MGNSGLSKAPAVGSALREHRRDPEQEPQTLSSKMGSDVNVGLDGDWEAETWRFLFALR